MYPIHVIIHCEKRGMKHILGISALYHDSFAVPSGHHVAAAQKKFTSER